MDGDNFFLPPDHEAEHVLRVVNLVRPIFAEVEENIYRILVLTKEKVRYGNDFHFYLVI